MGAGRSSDHNMEPLFLRSDPGLENSSGPAGVVTDNQVKSSGAGGLTLEQRVGERGARRPLVKPAVRPMVRRRYPGGWPPQRTGEASLLFPIALIGFVLALAITLIYGIVIRGPDAHANLWNSVRDYSRTIVGEF